MDDVRGVSAEALLARADWMRGLARSLVRGGESADDLAQESWATVLARPPAHGRGLAAWLRKAVANVARQDRRSEGRREQRELARAPAEGPPSAEALVLEAELQREVVSAILELDEPYRSTVLLRFYRDLAPARIAALSGIPAATVRSRLKRALDELRARLDGSHGGERRAWSAVLAASLRDSAPAATGTPAKVAAALAGVLLASLWAVGRWPGASGGSSDVVATELRAPRSAAREPVAERPPAAAESAPTERVAVRASSSAGPLFLGSVSDPDGAAIAGATVRLLPLQGDPAGPHLAAGLSGDDGRFAIPAPAGLDATAPLSVRAEASGYQSVTRDPCVPEDPIELEMAWTTEVFGRVLDARTGRPVSGVRISALATPQAVTGLDGRYRVRDVPVGSRRRLVAFGPGYALHEELLLADSREPLERDVLLERGAPVTLRVFDDETGQVLDGVEVSRKYFGVLAETDARGEATLHFREREDLALELEKDGFACLDWHRQRTDAGVVSSPSLPMRRLGWIEGVLRDEEGAPLAACWLYAETEGRPFDRLQLPPERLPELGLSGYLVYEASEHGPSGRTDERGRFAVPVIPSPEPFRVTGGSLDHVAVDLDGLVVATGGQRAWLELVQRRGATIRGSVRYNGRPWSAGAVQLLREAGVFGWARIETDGRYVLRGVPAGAVTLRLHSTEGEVHEFPEPLELVVEAGREYACDLAWEEDLVPLRGIVLRRSGEPAAGVRVHASTEDVPRSFATTTEPDGRFELEVPRELRYALGASDGEASARPLRDVPADAADVELVLPEAWTLRLRAVDAATGEVVRLAELPDPTTLMWRESGTERYRRALRPEWRDGAVDLTVWTLDAPRVDLCLCLSERFASEEVLDVPLAPGPVPTLVEVPLARSTACELVLVDAPSVPAGSMLFLLGEEELHAVSGPYDEGDGRSNLRLNGVQLWLANPCLSSRVVRFDSRGEARVPGLAPGRYTVRAHPGPLALEPEWFDVPAGGARVELRPRAR